MLVLTISGSLRHGGSSTALLDAAALLAPPGMMLEAYRGLASLPAFNPDLDTGDATLLPHEVAELHRAVGRADALIVSSPEYAHGVPGSLKNALDWLVGSLEFPGKPVALLMASSRATYARAQLLETLRTMSARIVDGASVTIDVPRGATADSIAVDPSLAEPLARALGSLVAFA